MKINSNFIAMIYDPIFYFALRPIRLKVMYELIEYKGKDILDLCCGTGNQLKILSKNGFEHLYCLDNSRAMLNRARKKQFNINAYHEDATRTHLRDNSFDVIIVSFALHEKDRKTEEALLKEAHRIIKTNGLLLIVDYIFDTQSSGFTKMLINLIERIAGGEHFINFKSYMKNHGISSLIKEEKFKLIKHCRMTSGTVILALYKKI